MKSGLGLLMYRTSELQTADTTIHIICKMPSEFALPQKSAPLERKKKKLKYDICMLKNRRLLFT